MTIKGFLRKLILSILILSLGQSIHSQEVRFEKEYLEQWKKFYPSKAYAMGWHESIFNFEDFSEANVQAWVDFNKNMVERVEGVKTADHLQSTADARLIKYQALAEIAKFEEDRLHTQSLQFYIDRIPGGLTQVIEAKILTDWDKGKIICQRLKELTKLCDSAIYSVRQGKAKDIEATKEMILSTLQYLEREVEGGLSASRWKTSCPGLQVLSKDLKARLNDVLEFIENDLSVETGENNSILGRVEYERRFEVYTHNTTVVAELEEQARKEIEIVKRLMAEVSRRILNAQNLDVTSWDEEKIIKRALALMEADAPKNGDEYLKFWQDLSARASAFVETKQIATLPVNETLDIKPAPESAGPAARIGWVSSAPPFAPNPQTTLYLPSIPDTLSLEEQRDFWSSFNKPFNRFIVIHELFPGHYMQMKIARETPFPWRLVFPYGPYIEGWATFCERIALDNGWMKGDDLTFLAHLRKRLENANRAYTSVQAHCNNWTEEMVIDFSIKESLLAPQFAKSLWGRLMRSPMQMTSYFLGGQQFSKLYDYELNRLGESFVLKNFMDAILISGPIPIDEFKSVFKAYTKR